MEVGDREGPQGRLNDDSEDTPLSNRVQEDDGVFRNKVFLNSRDNRASYS